MSNNLTNIRIKTFSNCNPVKFTTILAFLIISVWSFSVSAGDCLVSTDARRLMKGYPDLQDEKLIKNEGQYSALLRNGDIVLAKFSTCSLGMSAHYFSVKKLSNNELLKRLTMFLGRAVSSEMVAKKVLAQLADLDANKFKQAVIFQGLGSQHQLIVKPSASPIFKQHIQYDWIPPEF